MMLKNYLIQRNISKIVMFVSFKILYESTTKSCRITGNMYMRVLPTSHKKFKYVIWTFRWFSIAVDISTQISYGRRSSSYKYPRLANEWSLVWFSGFHGYGRSLSLSLLLTYSMVQSTSWEANWFAASKEIPRISRNPKVHYRTHKRPPRVPILGQPNPVHIPTSHLLEIHSNIIHPSTPKPPQWSLSLRLPHQDHIHPPLLTHTRHMPSPSHSSRFYHLHNNGWGVNHRIIK